MAKQLINEAEKFLLDHWADACLLEDAMKQVRKKYKEVFERVVEEVTEAHPELDAKRVVITQSWTDGQIVLGRKSWGINKWGTPSGFWVGNLRLEVMAADDPYSCMWITEQANVDCDAAREIVNESAKSLLTPKELAGTKGGDEDTLLWFPVPSKAEFITALCDGDGQKFVGLFVSQFEMMARFVPVIDRVFRECLKKE